MKTALLALCLWLFAATLAAAQCIDCGVYPEIASGGAGAGHTLVAIYMLPTPSAAPSSGSASFFPPAGSTSATSNEAGLAGIITSPGTVANLRVNTASLAASTSWTVVVRKAVPSGAAYGAFASQTVTCTVSAGQSSCTDDSAVTSHGDHFNVGDKFDIMATPTNTPANTVFEISFTITDDTGQHATIFTTAQTMSGASALYAPIGTTQGGNATEAIGMSVSPTLGTFDQFYFTVPTVTAAHFWTGTVHKLTQTTNPCDTDSTAGTPTKASASGAIGDGTHPYTADTSSSVHVAQGDCLSYGFIGDGGATMTSTIIPVSMRWTPDTNYEMALFGMGTTSLAATPRYAGMQTTFAIISTEASAYAYLPPVGSYGVAAYNLTTIQNVAVGGTNHTWQIRQNGASLSPDVTCTATTAQFGCNSSATATALTDDAVTPYNLRFTSTGGVSATTWDKRSLVLKVN